MPFLADNSRKMPMAKGSASMNVQKSAIAIVASRPCIPAILGTINMAGIKNNPCLLIAKIVAGSVLQIFCNSMFVGVVSPTSGNAMHCHLRTLAPISISTGSSLRKNETICGANIIPVTDIIRMVMVLVFIVKR